MDDDRVGRLFPIGGPVPPPLVIGRAGEIDDVERRLREGIHTMLVGPRRIGKTTVCGAACERLHSAGTPIVEVEVPQRADAAALLQLVIDRCNRISLAAAGRRVLRAARPLVKKLLEDQGLPLDLGELGGSTAPVRCGTPLRDDGGRTVHRAERPQARRLDPRVGIFEVEMGIDEAKRHLVDDGA